MMSRLRKILEPCVRLVCQAKKGAFSQKYLLYTNTGLAVFLSCAGDGMQQRFQILKQQLKGWNRPRTGHVALSGLLIGPFCHYWYIFLDWWLPGKTARIIMKKVVLDQLICSTVVIGTYLTITTGLEGKCAEEVKSEVMEKGLTLYIAEWIIWPPAQIVNFYLLPTKYRVLYDNSISCGFDCYFAHVKYGKRTNFKSDVKS